MDKLEKVKRAVGVDAPVSYLYQECRYLDIPKGMKVTQYYYNSKDNIYYGVLRKKVPFIIVLLFIISTGVFLFCSAKYLVEERTIHDVIYDRSVYVHDGYVALNVVNPKSNKYPVKVQLLNVAGNSVTDEYEVEIGHSIGNVPLLDGVELSSSGSYKLKYTVNEIESVYSVVVIPFEKGNEL